MKENTHKKQNKKQTGHVHFYPIHIFFSFFFFFYFCGSTNFSPDVIFLITLTTPMWGNNFVHDIRKLQTIIITYSFLFKKTKAKYFARGLSCCPAYSGIDFFPLPFPNPTISYHLIWLPTLCTSHVALLSAKPYILFCQCPPKNNILTKSPSSINQGRACSRQLCSRV